MRKILGIIALSVSILTACESPEATDSSGGKNQGISFATSITRAVDNQWEVNDSIGVFQVLTGNDFSGALAKNTPYVTAEGNGSFASSKPLYYPDGETGTFDFIAYYPYQKGITKEYIVDVSSQKHLNKLDFLYAKTIKQNAGNLKVNLQFEHCLSNLEVEVKAGKDVTSLEGLSLTLKGSPTHATFTFADAKLTVTSNSIKDIRMNTSVDKEKTSALSKAIVIPSSWTGCTLDFNLPEYGNFTYQFKEGSFLSGKKYKLVATLSKAGTIQGVELEGLDTSIDNWNTEGGDMGSVEDNFNNSSTPEPQPPAEGGDGTKASPYNIAQLLNYKDLPLANKQPYVRGYLVGMVNFVLDIHWGAMTAEQFKDFSKGSCRSFLLADSPNERTPARLVIASEVFNTHDEVRQNCLPFTGQQVTFQLNAKNGASYDEDYIKICSGVAIKTKQPLVFNK